MTLFFVSDKIISDDEFYMREALALARLAEEIDEVCYEVDREIEEAIAFAKASPLPDKEEFLRRVEERYSL